MTAVAEQAAARSRASSCAAKTNCSCASMPCASGASSSSSAGRGTTIWSRTTWRRMGCSKRRVFLQPTSDCCSTPARRRANSGSSPCRSMPKLMQRSYATMARLPLQADISTTGTRPITWSRCGPITVSSVDSGNFVASLYTLRTGTLALLKRPLLERRLFAASIPISGCSRHWRRSVPARSRTAAGRRPAV